MFGLEAMRRFSNPYHATNGYLETDNEWFTLLI